MSPSIIQRVTHLFSRRRAARRLGVRFDRAASFQLPSHIQLRGKSIELSVPAEACQVIAFVEVLLDDCYDLGSMAREHRVRTVIDIGANVGLFGLAARVAFPDAVVHAYEPNGALEANLNRHAAQAGFSVFLEAVGLHRGTVSIDIDPEQSVLTRTHQETEGVIPQIAFAEAVERIGGHVDLVKMDCEGAEWDILRDTASWSRVDHLSMEYHLQAGQTHESVRAVLGDVGFDVVWQRPLDGFGLVRARRHDA